MKQYLLVYAILLTLISCSNADQPSTLSDAKKLVDNIKQNRPGTVSTSATGYTMTANIDGKEWVAESMMPPDIAGRVIGYFQDNYIGLPFSKNRFKTGKKIILGPDEGADLFIGNGCLFKDTKGEIVIINVVDKIVEGHFNFTTTCTSTNKNVEVSNGYFRILVQ